MNNKIMLSQQDNNSGELIEPAVCSILEHTAKYALKAQHNSAQWQRLGSEMRTKQICALKGQFNNRFNCSFSIFN